MTIVLLYNNKGPSAVCQQNFMTASTAKYLSGLSSIQSNVVGTLDVECNAAKTPNVVIIFLGPLFSENPEQMQNDIY